jgi:hypothetical protein
MRRREFIAGLGGAASWSLAVRAQRMPMQVIGFLHAGSPDQNVKRLTAFRKGLGDVGFVEGQNVAIEYRWANGHVDQLRDMAADLIRRQVAVIATPGSTDPHSPPNLPQRQFRSSSPRAATSLPLASSPASAGRAAMSPAPPR